MVSHITSKKSGVLKAELLKHQAKYIKQGFKVRSLFCDGESGVGAIIPDIEINKIDVQIAGPETHIGRVEVAIKYLKQMARSIIASLDYKLSSSLIVWLIYHVASRSNFVPISTLSETITPREYMLGRQLDYKLDLQLKFGERVEVHQRSDNSMSPRTRPGIALVSTGNLYGSWKVLMLDTMKIATMDAWTPVASLSKEDIDLMNKLAESKGSQPLSTKLEFELAGGRPVGDDLNPEDYEQLMHMPEARRDREIVPTDEPDFTEETPEAPAATTFEAEPSVGGADVPVEPVQSEERVEYIDPEASESAGLDGPNNQAAGDPQLVDFDTPEDEPMESSSGDLGGGAEPETVPVLEGEEPKLVLGTEPPPGRYISMDHGRRNARWRSDSASRQA